MAILITVLACLLLAVVIAVVSGPLRAADRAFEDRTKAQVEGENRPSAQVLHTRADLETERETKYREIRDAELDFRTGKLSREDYETVDGALRAEALEILDGLQELDRSEGAKDRPDGADWPDAED